MILAYPLIDSSPEPALRVSRRPVELGGPPLSEAEADHALAQAEREQLYLIDMRYQQHLAERALEELFEIGALENLQS